MTLPRNKKDVHRQRDAHVFNQRLETARILLAGMIARPCPGDPIHDVMLAVQLADALIKEVGRGN